MTFNRLLLLLTSESQTTNSTPAETNPQFFRRAERDIILFTYGTFSSAIPNGRAV